MKGADFARLTVAGDRWRVVAVIPFFAVAPVGLAIGKLLQCLSDDILGDVDEAPVAILLLPPSETGHGAPAAALGNILAD
jgi:hypothetical protein